MDVERELGRLEHANEALRRANARLARGLVGSSGSAAAALLAKLQLSEQELARARAEVAEKARTVRDLTGRIEELGVELAVASRSTELLEAELQRMQETRTWRLAGRFWSLRDRLLRRGGAL